jgi:MFS family permease
MESINSSISCRCSFLLLIVSTFYSTIPIRSISANECIKARLCLRFQFPETIVATAIPTIVSDLGTASGYAWIGGAYVLASAATSPIWVKLSDIWGRKPIILTASALFFGSSIVTASSKTMTMLIVGRSLQGVSSGGIGQLAIIVISDIFSLR